MAGPLVSRRCRTLHAADLVARAPCADSALASRGRRAAALVAAPRISLPIRLELFVSRGCRARSLLAVWHPVSTKFKVKHTQVFIICCTRKEYILQRAFLSPCLSSTRTSSARSPTAHASAAPCMFVRACVLLGVCVFLLLLVVVRVLLFRFPEKIY